MKNATYLAILMTITIIFLPLIIVKGCSSNYTKKQIGNEGFKIKVYVNNEKKERDMDFEEYIKGVVAAEMPAEFEPEALKAQAVAARTYAFSRMKGIYRTENNTHNDSDVCTDPAHCQAWVSKQTAMKRWGIFSAIKYWNKIDRAVNETRDIIITYNNNLANPLFHSNSGGRTENAEEVWTGVEVPYLKSVTSDGEDVTSEFKNTVTLEIKVFINKLKSEYSDFKINEKDIFKDIKVVDFTAGGRVKTIKIGNHVIKGTEFRRIYQLRSANFNIEKGEKESLKIIVFGNGHGVGMSQWGANYLAKQGGSYEEIIKYYYKGVELSTIDKF